MSTRLLSASQEDVRSFLTKVQPLPSGYLFWTGGRSRGSGNRSWYGSFWMPSLGQAVRAHRFSSEVFNCEECPPGYHRDHECCFSLCVHPEHIKVVTKERNQELKVLRQTILRPKEQIALLAKRWGLDSF
jgi:hypothetical protein